MWYQETLLQSPPLRRLTLLTRTPRGCRRAPPLELAADCWVSGSGESTQHSHITWISGLLQFFHNQIPRLSKSITQHSLTYSDMQFSTESTQHKLSRHADFTTSINFIPRFLTFFSSTHFTYWWSLAKYQLCIRLLAHFLPSDAQFTIFPNFPGNFAFSLSFPDQSNSLTFSSFPWPVGTMEQQQLPEPASKLHINCQLQCNSDAISKPSHSNQFKTRFHLAHNKR